MTEHTPTTRAVTDAALDAGITPQEIIDAPVIDLTDDTPAPEYKPTDLLTAKQIAELRGVTPKTIVNYHKTARDAGYPEGKFPRPSKVVEDRYPRWKFSVIKRYFAMADARGGPGDFRTGPDRTPRIRKDAKELVDQ